MGQPHAAPLLTRAAALIGGSMLAILVAACQPKPPAAPEQAIMVVPVSKPIERRVTDFIDYTGRTDAVLTASIRPRVTGFIMKTGFVEGADVKKGDILFEIDDRPYRVLVDQAKSQVVLNQASWKLAKATYERDKDLVSSSAVSAQQLDQDKASLEQADAQIKVSEAALRTAELNLSFCKVEAPISGRISRYYYTQGNLVTQDQTLLTTIVSMETMYAYFDVDQPTYQKLGGNPRTLISPPRRLPAKPEGLTPIGTNPTAAPSSSVIANKGLPVEMSLKGEDGFPHRGKINFVNNQENPSTGTISFRAVFDNLETENGNWVMLPGMFVRLRMPIGAPHNSLLVIDRAVGSDQGLKFVYVLDAEDKVEYRQVTVGALEADGLRVIESGLKPDDRVIVGSLQMMRPRMQVQPELIEMPTVEPGTLPSRSSPQPPPAGKKKP